MAYGEAVPPLEIDEPPPEMRHLRRLMFSACWKERQACSGVAADRCLKSAKSR